MINHKGKLYRPSPRNSKNIEVSTDGGKFWRMCGTVMEEVVQLISHNGDIIAETAKGIFTSKDDGKFWRK